MSTWLHEQRFAAVDRVVRELGPRRVLDLGCGDGELFLRLARSGNIERIVGIDLCHASLARLQQRLAASGAAVLAEVELVHGSMLAAPERFPDFDCALLIETIEHIDPHRLSALEMTLFRRARPASVVVTTPNAEYNPLLGVPARRFRHPDHRFEWDRERFRLWARSTAERSGYEATCSTIAGAHPTLGGASQMAVFRRCTEAIRSGS